MKRLGRLWPRVVDPTNLELALKRAARGKRRRDDVSAFLLDQEAELVRLRQELTQGTWKPGGYRCFWVYEAKPRRIWVAPFRDRVVHHALMNVLEPEIDRRLIFDCHACRQGKGTHRAIARYQQFARRYAYVLKLDIVRFFPSVDHDVLKRRLRRLVKDGPTLDVCDAIVDSARDAGDGERCGLPIGNLTSQIWANWYLSDVDHSILQELKPGGYLRYVDDLFLFDDDKARLRTMATRIEECMAELGLALHRNKRILAPSRAQTPVLGFLVGRDFRHLPSANARRARRRLVAAALAYRKHQIDLRDVRARVTSWLGHAGYADGKRLQKAVLRGIVFRRATTK